MIDTAALPACYLLWQPCSGWLIYQHLYAKCVYTGWLVGKIIFSKSSGAKEGKGAVAKWIVKMIEGHEKC